MSGPGTILCVGRPWTCTVLYCTVCWQALDLYWHEDCLKCGCCDARLGEVGHSLYTKGNLLLCKRDYLRWAEINLYVNHLFNCFAGQTVRVHGLLLCV